MIKELKYLTFLVVIISFFFFTAKHYFSDKNIKNSFRALENIDMKINNYEKNLIILENNTNNIIEYVDKQNEKKKKYYFLDLLNFDD
tara:strand:- start:48 stop:308 length:261 start_codon:yes stop_codon:yes gene_type:complete